MGYKKKELKQLIRKTKKIIKMLKKLQNLCWSTPLAGAWEFIKGEEQRLEDYKTNLLEIKEKE